MHVIAHAPDPVHVPVACLRLGTRQRAALRPGLDAGPGDRVLLLGTGTLALGCALLRAGAMPVAEVPGTGDVVIMPLACSRNRILGAIGAARRGLRFGGLLALGGVPPTLASRLTGRLALAGFTVVPDDGLACGAMLRSRLSCVCGLCCAGSDG